ncbi:MAG: response regulator [Desulfomonile tiedjei]|nr:response regulator [Desulfomonile tiedjei]
MKSTGPILLVDDDKVDAMAVKRAIKELNIPNPLKVANNGEQALEYLRDSKNPKPCLILLDINMPRMNGIEFLKVAKQDDSLRPIPIIMLTTSREYEDKYRSFDLGVAGYMIKPASHVEFIELVRAIDSYWTASESIAEA